MTKETRERIKAYKAQLPGLKERVMAVALLLVMSVIMMASASYAWITISANPEATGMTTNVTANGNLEIALVNPGGTLPEESKVGDSAAAQGQSLTSANLTWGNLVNLSDASYGLENIILRPALLSSSSNLLEQPLRSVEYGADGRVELYYNEDFQFLNWVEPKNDIAGYFTYLSTPQYGVRAIGTVEYKYVNNNYYQYTQLMKAANGARDNTETNYTTNVIGNEDYINALAGLIGDFMTDKLNDTDSNVGGYMEDVYGMMSLFEGVVDDYANALVALANVQVYNKYGPDDYQAHTYTEETLLAATDTEMTANGVSLEGLADYKEIVATIKEVMYGTDDEKDDCIYDLYKRVEADKSAQVLMSELQPYINELVHINSCKIICEGNTYVVGSLGMSAATQLLGKDIDAVITKGALKDFEQLSGCKMYATDVQVSATYMFTVTMTAKTITTSAADPYTWNIDADATAEVANSNKGDYTAVAQDTYGMAVDFWVRTNAADSYLILEGNVLTKTEEVAVTGVNADGELVNLYTATVTTTVTNDDGEEETITTTVTVYPSTDEDGNAIWCNSTTHGTVSGISGTPVQKMEEIKTVIGYEGENRVWDDNQFLDSSSTTQGNGSCYVFYADDPAQQKKSLELLSNFRVAFIDSNETSASYGKVVGLAKLDTEQAYEENGKVTIPLVLTDDGGTYLTKNGSDLAILPLDQNVATRVTAVVYLDGRELSNEDVLAAGEIQGQLNLQFGSTEDLEAVSDEPLELATRSVSAAASKVSGSFPSTNSQIQFSYDSDENLTVYVKVTVDGEQPSKLSAFFMRKVNSTQGSREKSFNLTYNETDGCWYGEYTFTAPGEYVLRTVQLDGVDYDLPSGDYPDVLIEGFAIQSVGVMCEGNEVLGGQAMEILTGNQAVSASLTLKMASNQKLPGNVKLQFVSDSNVVTATLAYSDVAKSWVGSVKFITSGEYRLQYVIMDGEYTELSAAMQRTLELYMGITVSVEDPGTVYHNTTWGNEPYTIPMEVEIFDNTGEEIRYLTNAKLCYLRSGSKVDGMNPDITWDGTQDCYTGNLLVNGPGIYEFHSVTIGANSTLKNVEGTTPVFTCISPNPPSYVDNAPMDGMDYLLSTPDNTIKVGVRIADAEAATVTAVLRNNDTGEDYTVSAIASATETIDGKPVSTFYFELPANEEGYQSGDWTITQLQLINVYGKADADGNSPFYDEENPMVWTVDKTYGDLSVKVVNVVIEITGEDETIGVDADGNVTATFMSTGTASGIEIKITDQYGKKLEGDVELPETITIVPKYVTNSSQTHGGYSFDDSIVDGKLTALTASPGSDGMTYTFSGLTMPYAGEYYLTMEFAVSDTDENGNVTASQTYKADRTDLGAALTLPSYIYKTAAPTVTISSVSTNPTTARYYTSATPGETEYNNMLTGSFNSKIDDHNAVVYMYFAEVSNYDNEAVTIIYPTVTLGITGIPTDHSGATMVFGNGSNSASGSTFTFAAGKTTASSSIGAGVDGTYDYGAYVIGAGIETYPILYPAGKQTVQTITVTYGGATYTVTLSDAVTINNPLYPPYVDFVVDDSTFTGTTPSRIYGTPNADGTFTITLPSVTSWDVDDGEPLNELPTDLSTLTPSTTTSKFATYSGGRINGTWTKYDVTTKVYTFDVQTRAYKVRHQVIGWTDGTNIYYLEDTSTITINSATTLTAVIDTSYTHSESIETKTYVRTVITHTVTTASGKSYSTPSGYTKGSPPAETQGTWELQT